MGQLGFHWWDFREILSLNNFLRNIQGKHIYRDILMAKDETVLQGMIDKLIEIGRCCGMEMNVEKTKVMRIPNNHPQ
jgi:hypothetical protein